MHLEMTQAFRLEYDLHCVRRGIKLYSLTQLKSWLEELQRMKQLIFYHFYCKQKQHIKDSQAVINHLSVTT